MTEHQRINLDEVTESRAPIDANWSPRKKAIVGGMAALAATSAVTAGVWWTMASQPPRLPRTADEAITLLASSQFDNLDEDRQRQYAAEAGRLMRELPQEERRALFEDETNRDAMRKVFEERMDEMVRRFARGESMDRGPRGERPQRPEGEGEGPRPNREELTEEERQQRREEFRERMNEQIQANAQSGNAQSSGLRAEMMKRMRSSGQGGGGFGRGRGGGGGGGPRGG